MKLLKQRKKSANKINLMSEEISSRTIEESYWSQTK